MTTFLVDCGHGGASAQGKSTATGLIGPAGLREKDVALEIGKRVARYLGSGAALTRTGDQNLSIGQRIDAARQRGADAFVSVHAGNGTGSGSAASIWVHPRAGQRSRELGCSISRQFARYGSGAAEVKAGELAVLDPGRHDPRTAACLVEVGQMSSPAGERQLRDPAFLDKMARAIADGARGVAAYGRQAAATALEGEPTTIADYIRPYRDIMDRAVSDSAFKEQLLADPIQVLADHGIALPAGVAPAVTIQLRAAVSGGDTGITYATIPALMEGELTAQLLPEQASDLSGVAAALAEPGFTARRTFWGVEISLSHEAVIEVSKGMNHAAIILGVVAALLTVASLGPQGAATGPAAAVTGLVIALLAAGADVITMIDQGNGITITVPWLSLIPGVLPIAIPAPR
jgi:hypothetical protein